MFAFCYLILIGNGYLPQLLLTKLQNYPQLNTAEWKNNNAVVVLGGGTTVWPENNLVSLQAFTYARTLEAARLYHACKASGKRCNILASGGDPQHHGIAEAQVIRNNLVAVGVTANDITIEDKSLNTYQNAQFISKILQQTAYDNIALVTSGVHMQRSILYFANFKIEVKPAPADYLKAIPTLIPIAYNMAIMDYGLHEVLGMARLHLYNKLGWN